ncbi:hypothetical protein POM88_035206 [Heracleum sosnowskyi]|uniref:Response regulatory domain-containing protein n=1 Tax=Heracleum sosnowskyi TaxID=360622 RepID=A0AAD8HKZ3_9APIA|nr:hypothetical protein POM88_035206 [Heracleum sosnowskyi]
MYNVLVVDDDPTCLTILKANLQKWSYEVTAVNHGHDALCRLRAKPYDIVLSDVHMPLMDGFELLRQINQEFRLPVILISSDSKVEVLSKGFQSGAQFFLVKPVVAEDVKNIWQFSEWWKCNINKRVSPISEINRLSQENAGGNIAISADNFVTERTKKFVWTQNLHTRFVESLLVLGYHEAVPRTILEFMNVPELRREQVGSHLQKYRQFMDRVLDGSAEIERSRWIDPNCYSSFVSGNPHLMLLNQLRNEKRTFKLVAPNTSGGANNYMFTSANHIGTSGTAPYHNDFYSNQAFNMGGQGSNSVLTGHKIKGGQEMSTGVFLDSNQFGNTSAVNEHLLGGGQMTNQNFFTGHNINGNYQLRIVKHDPSTDISFGANQLGNTSAASGHQLGARQMTVPNLFNGHNIDGSQQLSAGGMTDQKSRFNNSELGNTSAANEHQLGAPQMTVSNLFTGHNIDGGQQLSGGGMTDQKNRFNNNEVLPPYNSLVGPNLIQGKDGEDFWGDLFMHVDIADDKNVVIANEIGDDSDEADVNSGDSDDSDEDDENPGDSDDDADYDPEE